MSLLLQVLSNLLYATVEYNEPIETLNHPWPNEIFK